MKLPTDSQIQLVILMQRLRHPALLVVAVLIFFAVPGTFAKLVALCLGLNVLLLLRDRRQQAALWLVGVTAAYAATMLLTPVSHYLGMGASALLAALLAFSFPLLLDQANPLNHRQALTLQTRASHPLLPVLMLGWLLVVLVLLLPGLEQAPPVRGDESYHLMSAQLYRLHLQALLLNAWPGVAWGVWLALVMWAICRRPRRQVLVVLVGAGLLLAVISAATAYPPELLEHPMAQARAMRYPPAMAWLSGLMVMTVGEIGSPFYASTGFYRLLTVLSLTGLVIGLGLDPRWRHRPLPVVLAGAALLTIPTIHYHAGILYLDLPVVALATLILLDASHLLKADARELPTRASWWMLILLGMVKESAAPLLLLFLGARWVFQLWHGHITRHTTLPRQLRREIWGSVIVLQPVVIYLLIRHRFGARGYGSDFANLLSPSLWWEGLSAIGVQSGLILLAALAGLVVLWRRRRFWELALLVAAFVGMKAFFLADSSEYVRLARFNLYVLPPVVVLAWEAYTALFRRQRLLALIAVCAVIGTNLWLSPVQLNGQRASSWGETGEDWYPFDRAMDDLMQAVPESRLALAGLEVDYGLNIIASQLRWPVNPAQIYSTSDDPGTDLEQSLDAATEAGLDTVLFIEQQAWEAPPVKGGWQLWRTYHGTGGTLAVYRREAR